MGKRHSYHGHGGCSSRIPTLGRTIWPAPGRPAGRRDFPLKDAATTVRSSARNFNGQEVEITSFPPGAYSWGEEGGQGVMTHLPSIGAAPAPANSTSLRQKMCHYPPSTTTNTTRFPSPPPKKSFLGSESIFHWVEK